MILYSKWSCLGTTYGQVSRRESERNSRTWSPPEQGRQPANIYKMGFVEEMREGGSLRWADGDDLIAIEEREAEFARRHVFRVGEGEPFEMG